MVRRICIARSTRCRICARRRASRPARCAVCCRCCAVWSSTASRTTSPSCSTHRARRSATSGTPTTRRIARRCPTISTLQIAPLHDLVRAHGWPLLMIEGVEADDVIGTLARQAKRSRHRHADLDVGQGSRATRRARHHAGQHDERTSGSTTTPSSRSSACGPTRCVDLLALTGDAIDNVPGVPKVGPKTAAKWLVQYGTLDNVIAHAARNSRRRRPEPARRARVAAGGQAAADGEMRLRAAVDAGRNCCSGHRKPSGCARCTSASSSRGWLQDIARGDRDPSLAGAAGAATAPATFRAKPESPPAPSRRRVSNTKRC